MEITVEGRRVENGKWHGAAPGHVSCVISSHVMRSTANPLSRQ